MTAPSVANHVSGGITSTSGSLPALTVTAGDAVYVLVTEQDTFSLITGLSDGTNTYVKNKTVPGGPTVTVWVAENVSGSSLTITISRISGSDVMSAVALDVTGVANPSYDASGTGSNGGYTSGVDESDSVSPARAGGLLILTLGLLINTGAGGPATYNAEAGETLVDSFSKENTGATAWSATGVYSENSSGTGSQTLKGNASYILSSTANYSVVVTSILAPAPAGGGPLYLAA